VPAAMLFFFVFLHVPTLDKALARALWNGLPGIQPEHAEIDSLSLLTGILLTGLGAH
jgi:hypothetical protein